MSTGILLDPRRAIEAERQDVGLSLRHFFLRRLVRPAPAFYLLLRVGSALDLGALRETLDWHLPYLSNLNMILDGRWLPGITHVWSLAVEELFYIVWAFAVSIVPCKFLVSCVSSAIVSAPVSIVVQSRPTSGSPSEFARVAMAQPANPRDCDYIVQAISSSAGANHLSANPFCGRPYHGQRRSPATPEARKDTPIRHGQTGEACAEPR